MEREGCGLGVMDYFGWCHSVGGKLEVDFCFTYQFLVRQWTHRLPHSMNSPQLKHVFLLDIAALWRYQSMTDYRGQIQQRFTPRCIRTTSME